jgi:hypothetical protein
VGSQSKLSKTTNSPKSGSQGSFFMVMRNRKANKTSHEIQRGSRAFGPNSQLPKMPFLGTWHGERSSWVQISSLWLTVAAEAAIPIYRLIHTGGMWLRGEAIPSICCCWAPTVSCRSQEVRVSLSQGWQLWSGATSVYPLDVGAYFHFSVFSVISGICFSLKANPNGENREGFGTVLRQPGSRAGCGNH